MSSATIQKANAVVLAKRPELNRAARQIVLAIGQLETGFGVDGSWLFEDGTPSYNWGGLVGAGTNGSLVHGDHNPDGSPVEYKFQAFHTMEEAFEKFFSVWSRGDISGVGHPDVTHEPTTLPAAARGDARAVATTMYAHGYYGGVAGGADDRIDAYAKAIDGAAKTVAAALGEKSDVVLSAKGAPAVSTAQKLMGPLIKTRAKAGAIASALGGIAVLAFSAPVVPALAATAAVYYVLRRDRKLPAIPPIRKAATP